MDKIFLTTTKKLATYAIKTTSITRISKTVEAKGDQIGNKIAGKITTAASQSTQEDLSK